MANHTTSRMAEAEPKFSGKQQEYYTRLLDIRDNLVDQVRTLSAHSLSSNKQAGEELADIGSDNFIREMEIGLMSEEGRQIQEIQAAIQRLKNGTYGICSECDKKIKAGRLEALPHAQLCIDCKAMKEKEAM